MSIVPPNTMIENGWIKDPHLDDIIALCDGNFIKVPLDELFKVLDNSSYHANEHDFANRGCTKMLPLKSRREGNDQLFWNISPNSLYIGRSLLKLRLPEDVVATLYTLPQHSTNGLVIPNNVYQEGDDGTIEFPLINHFGPSYLTTGTPIGRLLFQTYGVRMRQGYKVKMTGI